MLILLMHIKVMSVILNMSDLSITRNIIGKQLIHTLKGNELNGSLGWSINVNVG